MSKRKRVLYFMPVNPMNDRAGNITRCIQLLEYFERNSPYVETAFVSFDHWAPADKTSFEQKFPNIRLILIQHRENRGNYLKYFFRDKLSRLFLKKGLDQVTPFHLKQIRKQFSGNFDVTLISYVEWGRFVEAVPSKLTIIDTHDLITSQYLTRSGDRKSIGQVFQEELEILNCADEVWTYSIEEQYIFEQFLTNKVRLLPVSSSIRKKEKVENRIDHEILYVASDNGHNQRSIEWFIQEVLPLVNERFSLTVVGKICDKIEDNSRIEKVGVVDDLSDIYNTSKITICPMLSGTGIKIKVLESLGYGLPVVTNRRGVDGLVNKVSNGCLIADDPNQFAFYINKLLSDSQFYNQLQTQGAQFYESYYAPNNEIRILDECFLGKENIDIEESNLRDVK